MKTVLLLCLTMGISSQAMAQTNGGIWFPAMDKSVVLVERTNLCFRILLPDDWRIASGQSTSNSTAFRVLDSTTNEVLDILVYRKGTGGRCTCRPQDVIRNLYRSDGRLSRDCFLPDRTLRVHVEEGITHVVDIRYHIPTDKELSTERVLAWRRHLADAVIDSLETK